MLSHTDSGGRLLTVVLFCIAVALWGFIGHVLNKANLPFWRFLWGSLGLFVILMFFIRPIITQPLANGVTAISGVFGKLTSTFDAYFKYGIIYVQNGQSGITLDIDLECSGVIEIMAFLSLLAFFRVYTKYERIIVGVLGTLAIIICNSLRIIIICEIVHFFGVEYFSLAHTFIARIFFYVLTVFLYFFVFTKPHVFSMKIGGHTYANTADPS
jgi:exosortase family protein XrtG